MTMIEPYRGQPAALPTVPDYFIGAHEVRLNQNGRLALPPTFHVGLAAGGMLTCGFDGCLHLLPPQSWQHVAHYARELALLSEHGRQQRRLIFGSAVAVCPDEQGQILLPPDLLKYAGIRERLVLVGVESYIEIWAIHRWQDLREQLLHGNRRAPAARGNVATHDATPATLIHLNTDTTG